MTPGYQAIPKLQQQQQSPLVAYRQIGTGIDALLAAWLKLSADPFARAKADCSGAPPTLLPSKA
ncbi:hypothetical protein [Pseudomonas sp.]|uniref:hypothetical protein n=1 Tax=Pseudomonas sp. TaxID=306 RepID=UPI0025FF0612|nr:hypothetical protein [Pseudomonas sp.]